MSPTTFPCACCGHQALDEPPGFYDLCPVCFWEDDPHQLRWPDSRNGANGISLLEAQRVYRRLGAMDQVFVSQVRPATSAQPLDDGWRMIDPEVDSFEPADVEIGTWDDFYAGPYWWRATFWRRKHR